MLLAIEPVDARRRAVAQHQSVLHQLRLDQLHRADEARIVSLDKARERQDQERGIDFFGLRVLRESVSVSVVAVRQHILTDGLTCLLPLLHRPLQTVLLDRRQPAVEGHPHHDTGVGKRLFWATHLPQSVVEVRPVVGEIVNQNALQLPRVVSLFDALFAQHFKGDHDLSEHVGLALIDRIVTDPHGPGIGIPWQMV